MEVCGRARRALRMCASGPARAALTPAAKGRGGGGGGEIHPLCIALYRERIVSTLCWGGVTHLHGRILQ